jgi:farnesyl-diphosphate farnesyltransferase
VTLTRAEKKFLSGLLKASSRSFYLTLRMLPGPVRSQIGLAYLLARTTDTIADTEILPIADRREALRRLRERILGHSLKPLDLGDVAQHQVSSAERMLLEKVRDSLALLKKLPPYDLRLVREVLAVIMGAQQMDLTRFEKANSSKVVPLESAGELDDYLYRVAGCVGEFWTKICRAHLFPKIKLDEPQ